MKSTYKILADAYHELQIDIMDLLKIRATAIEDFLKEAYYYFPRELLGVEIKDVDDFFKKAQNNIWHYGLLQKTLNHVFKNDKSVSLLFVKYEDVLLNCLLTIRI